MEGSPFRILLGFFTLGWLVEIVDFVTPEPVVAPLAAAVPEDDAV